MKEVICVNNKSFENCLSVGKLYKVTGREPNMYRVEIDEGEEYWFDQDRFMPPVKNEPKLETIANEIGELVQEKNKAYGNSFGKSGDFLKLLYPDGIKPEQYQDMLLVVRIFDKQMRIANKKDAFGESPYRDIAGYGILGAWEGEGE